MKLVLLLLLSFTAVARPDTLDIVVFPAYEDSLQNALKAEPNQAFLQGFRVKFAGYYDNATQYSRFTGISVDALEMELFEQRAAQRKLMEGAAVSAFLKTHLLREIEFQYWHLLYAYPVVRANQDQKSRRLTSVPDVITRDFPRRALQEADNLKYKAFRQLIPFYVSYENSRQRNFEKYTNMLLMVNDKTEFSITHLSPAAADYSLAHLLSEHKAYLSVSLAQSVVSQINDEALGSRFTGKFLDDVVQRQASAEEEERKQREKAGPVLTFNDLKGKTFDLSKFKGKVVYIDFWASWCGPCRMQFPYARKLHESLPEKLKKDIVFLYISIDETEEKWKEGIRQNGLEPYMNGHVEGGWNAEVLKQLGIRSIPRYMLVDKTGKIIDPNAPRPNQPHTLSELIRLAE